MTLVAALKTRDWRALRRIAKSDCAGVLTAEELEAIRRRGLRAQSGGAGCQQDSAFQEGVREAHRLPD